MKLVSLNVGLPREVVWNGKPVTTGIFKQPVDGPRQLDLLNLDGDRQADLSVHGGPNKAVYGYPLEHYALWRAELPELAFEAGMFGENFTTEGLNEAELLIGERFRVGTAEVRVSEPRMPCYKLGVRFGQADMVKRFLASRRSGFYFAVVQPGMVTAGDEFIRLERPDHGVTVADITRVFAFEKDDHTTIRQITELENFSESWRAYFLAQLAA